MADKVTEIKERYKKGISLMGMRNGKTLQAQTFEDVKYLLSELDTSKKNERAVEKELKYQTQRSDRLDRELQSAQQEIEKLKKLAKRSHDIMIFHTYRCPMDIMNNFSGSEEHLAEYREVLDRLKEIGVTEE